MMTSLPVQAMPDRCAAVSGPSASVRHVRVDGLYAAPVFVTCRLLAGDRSSYPPKTTTSEPVHTAAALARAEIGAGGSIVQRRVAGLYAAPSPCSDDPCGPHSPPHTMSLSPVHTTTDCERVDRGLLGNFVHLPDVVGRLL